MTFFFIFVNMSFYKYFLEEQMKNKIIFILMCLSIFISLASKDLNAQTYTISGTVSDGIEGPGLNGVTITFFDGSTTHTELTAGGGLYSYTVTSGWRGSVTPTLTGYIFDPVVSNVGPISENEDRDFVGAVYVPPVSVSGTITDGVNPLEGVLVTFTPGGYTTTTLADGTYTLSVPSDYSGTAEPYLSSYSFAPADITYANITTDQTGQDYTGTNITPFYIAGTITMSAAPMAGVVMNGLPGNPITNSVGDYSVYVTPGWSGTATPYFGGFEFTPANRVYAGVSGHMTTENYSAAISSTTFTISGTVTGNAGALLSGALITFSDGNIEVTDGSGAYSYTVGENWSGSFVPSLAYYIFTPVTANINMISSNTIQNFSGTELPSNVIISGHVSGAGDGITMTLSTGYSIITDGSENYSFTVIEGWSGTVTPSKAGYTFTDPSTTYTNIVSNQTGQNYVGSASATTYTVSGNVSNASGAPMAGVSVWFSNAGGDASVLTSASGAYTYTVPLGWIGSVSPDYSGFMFSPALTTIGPVNGNVAQSFIGTRTVTTNTISGTVLDIGGARVPMSGVTIAFNSGGTVNTTTTDGAGEYTNTVTTGWSGTISASYSGYAFDPILKTIGSLSGDIVQDFSGISTSLNFTVFGVVTDNRGRGIANVRINFDKSGAGSILSTLTDSSGNYSYNLSGGWYGRIYATKNDMSFTPGVKNKVGPLLGNKTVDFTLARYAISGTVRDTKKVPLKGTVIEISDSSNLITDENGYYVFEVLSGWTGTVRAILAGHTFEPAIREYNVVNEEYKKQDFISLAFPEISLTRKKINIGITTTGNYKKDKTFKIINSGGGTLNWSISTNAAWIICTPETGSGSATISVTIDPAGLGIGNYTGEISVADPNATNSPQTISVSLKVKDKTEPPFGAFSTPLEGSTVAGAIPVTGWVLDDIGVESVKIYTETRGLIKYIGDAVLIEGARPDVADSYPDYPENHKAGWGYMLLTNLLPDGGNGTYTFFVKAKDIEGNIVSLGTKTIYIDNENSVKPFGLIDTPEQGGEASGDNYYNYGWVLTPQPNTILFNGSTIDVYVDGVMKGHPTYNIYRSDIASIFPGYNNSNGAGVKYSLDTTVYENGVHTISWVAKDSSGNSEGIGSRYFNIQNSGAKGYSYLQYSKSRIENIPINNEILLNVKIGHNGVSLPLKKNNDGIDFISLRELEQLTVETGNKYTILSGYFLSDSFLTSMPIGSSIDSQNNRFVWEPGPGFLGKYNLVLIFNNQNGVKVRKDITIEIEKNISYLN